MLYFKNSELADTYHVSVRTVRNWIKLAKEGKLDLTLHADAGHAYVSNTTGNIARIEELVKKGKKFRPHHTIKSVTPKPEFYSLFTQAQIYDIVSNLELHHEVPRDYNYIGKGAGNWDRYAERLEKEDAENLLNMTRKLLSDNELYIDSLLSEYDKVNIVDIGVGNALPVRDLLAHFLEKKRLGRYIAIDISQDMLEIAHRNIKKWFNNDVEFEDYAFDINKEGFANILAEDYLNPSGKKVGNLILFLGGTLQNFRKRDSVLHVVNGSMNSNDLFIHTQKLDSEVTRRYFDFNSQPADGSSLAPNHRFIFDLLNIGDECYAVEMGYDPDTKARYIRVRLKLALNIKFNFDNGGERAINLDKGESILLWRAWQDEFLDVLQRLDKNDFYTLHSSQTKDRNYLMTISQVKRD